MSMTLTDRLTRGTYLFDEGPGRPASICLSYSWMGDALKVLPLPIDQRVSLCLRALGKVYPYVDIASHIIGNPITVSWESDPNFLGAFKGALPGHYRYNHRMYCHFMQAKMPQAERGLFLAGDGISWTPAWAEGAITTALNAVWGSCITSAVRVLPTTKARATFSTISRLLLYRIDQGSKLIKEASSRFLKKRPKNCCFFLQKRRPSFPHKPKKRCPGRAFRVPVPFTRTRTIALNTTQPIDPCSEEEAAARASRHVEFCRELTDMGMGLARAAAARAHEELQSEPAAPKIKRAAGHASRAFARLARCVHQTMELENRIAAARIATVTRQAQLAKDRAFISSLDLEAVREAQRIAPSREYPSLMAAISKEVGFDVTDPSLPELRPWPK